MPASRAEAAHRAHGPAAAPGRGTLAAVSAKDDLLRQADNDFGALKRALVGLDDEAMRQPWLGVWGVREILAHIAGWHREMIPVLERLARGERPIPEGVNYEDFDAWNARHVMARRGLTAAGIRAELEASHCEFVAAARAVPESRFGPDKTATRVVDLNGPHHYREHAGQIRSWRRRTGL